MSAKSFISLLALLAILTSYAVEASSAIFPDVPVGHIHKESIERLWGYGIVHGNPDGTFEPEEPVNRAALLKLLYLAAGREPDASATHCFPDVEPGAWYEPYICDAAARGDVNGKPDGKFYPAEAVTRVAALKMVLNTLDIPVEELSSYDRETVGFVDVSTSAWYTKYLFTAFTQGVLPIPGQDGAFFKPDAALLRGEAAAYITNALAVNYQRSKQAESSSSSEEPLPDNVTQVTIPFEHSGKFDGKKPHLFTFDMAKANTVFFKGQLNNSQPGQLICRLYLLRDDGISIEYFLAQQETDSCYIHATLNPGNYQLQMQPTEPDVTFVASAQPKVGDGNDGFNNARRLYIDAPQEAALEADDLTDWYYFVVLGEKMQTLVTTNAAEVDCFIYPMADVDIFGFESPECHKAYSYPDGTYYIALSRAKALKSAKVTYSITLE